MINFLTSNSKLFTLLFIIAFYLPTQINAQITPEKHRFVPGMCGTPKLYDKTSFKDLERVPNPYQLENEYRNGDGGSWSVTDGYGSGCVTECDVTARLPYSSCDAPEKYQLPVVFRVGSTTCGGSGIPTQSEVDDMMDATNEFYDCVGLPIELVKCTSYDLASLESGYVIAGDGSTTSESFSCPFSESSMTEIPNVLNVFIVDNTGNGTGCNGYAYLPTVSAPNVLVMSNGCYANFSNVFDCSDPSSLEIAQVFTHEVGHFLGLFHTHDTDIADDPDFTSDDCSSGDYIEDTDEDPDWSGGEIGTEGCVSILESDCTPDLSDPNCIDYMTSNTMNNIMSYNIFVGCIYELTDCQKSKMIDALKCFKNDLGCCDPNITDSDDGSLYISAGDSIFICLNESTPTITIDNLLGGPGTDDDLDSGCIAWYENINDVTPLFVGDSFTPTLPNTPGIYSYYFDDDANDFSTLACDNNKRKKVSITLLDDAGTADADNGTASPNDACESDNFNVTTTSETISVGNMVGWYFGDDMTNNASCEDDSLLVVAASTITTNTVINTNVLIQSDTDDPLKTINNLVVDCDMIAGDGTYYLHPFVAYGDAPIECSVAGTSSSVTWSNGAGGAVMSSTGPITNCTTPSNYTCTYEIIVTTTSCSSSDFQLDFRSGVNCLGISYGGPSEITSCSIGETFVFTSTAITNEVPTFDPLVDSWCISAIDSDGGSDNITYTAELVYSCEGDDALSQWNTNGYPNLKCNSIGTNCLFGSPIEIKCNCFSCPTIVETDGTNTICDQELSNEITTWQSNIASESSVVNALADANTGSSLLYSSILSSTAVPDGILANGNHSGLDDCQTEDQFSFAYIQCFGEDNMQNTGDDTYLLAGTHTLTIIPLPQVPSESVVSCTNTITLQCAADLYGSATNPIGGADIVNWDASNGIYTSQLGDASGMIDITITNNYGGFTCNETFTVSTPACPANCPSSNEIDEGVSVCDGALTSEISNWQSNVTNDATNSTAIADANTAANVEYSSVLLIGSAVPDGVIASGVHSGLDDCLSENQTTFAYLLCFGPDATQGTADDSYLLLGEHTLTVVPQVQTPLESVSTCTNTITTNCANDMIGIATNATGGASIVNWDAINGIYTSQPGDIAGTIEIEISNNFGGTICLSSYIITTPACPANCPSTNEINEVASICDGALTTELSSWQLNVTNDVSNALAIADANTATSIQYSSILLIGSATPDGIVADGIHSGLDDCLTEDQTTYAYLLCFGPDATQGTTDDSYLLMGEHILTVVPIVQTPIETVNNCTNTISLNCPNDLIGSAFNPTGGANISNWDASNGIYTAQSGDLAGTIEVELSNNFSGTICMFTFTIATPACPANCPSVNEIDEAFSLCDGTLTTEISNWQSNLTNDATNASAIVDPNTSTNLEYGSILVMGSMTPNGVIGDGIHSGMDYCLSENQITYAYLLCFGPDATQGTADDTYILMGEHTLTVIPQVQSPTETISTCTNTITTNCVNDMVGIASNPTGGASMVNWDAVNGIYTSQAGDLAGTLEIEISNNFGGTVCLSTFTITTPACPDDCPTYNGATALIGIETGMEHYESDEFIESTQLIDVGADIIYDSKTLIDMQNGFEVKADATFEAKIDGCGNN